MIQDPQIATAYAVEAIGLIDHFGFRAVKQAAGRWWTSRGV
jgi:hypothetical protein